MATSANSESTSQELVRLLEAYIDRSVARNAGSTEAKKPNHRILFHWPPHPVSYTYHVLASDWTGRASFEAYGDTFDVEVARTPNGIFGRAPELWHEDRGDTEEEMLANLRLSSEPLLQRQLATNGAMERGGRFTGHVRDLSPLELLMLLYCEDRDVANDARSEIEKSAGRHQFLPALLAILEDRRHPNRRSAQWCALDLFEDLPSFCRTPEESVSATRAMKALIWDAEDDYARTVYKAGVVLGGHIPFVHGGPALLDCLAAPSRIGRRSAIHGLFHVVEWMPDARTQVVEALGAVAKTDSEPLLREYAARMALDIAGGRFEHVPDVVFPDEG